MKRRRPVTIAGIVHRVINAETKTSFGRTACRLFFSLYEEVLGPIAKQAVSTYGVDVNCMTCIVKSNGEGCTAPAARILKDLPRKPARINGVTHAVRYPETDRNAGRTLCEVRFTWNGKRWPKEQATAELAVGPVDCDTCLQGGP